MEMIMRKGNYLITGITGFIGSLITKKIMASGEYQDGDIKIIGLVRDRRKAEEFYSDCDCSGLSLAEADITDMQRCMSEMENISFKPDYIIHCAANTRSSYMISNPVETADGIVMGTRNCLELGRRFQVKGMIYLSSMEVYGTVSEYNSSVTEDMLGDINLLSARSCYPMGKRMAENYCCSYYKEYGVHVRIARLAQVFGIGVLPEDNRIFAQFANSVRENSDIILHTAGNSVGNYCESMDAVNAILTILFCGSDGEAYNVVNEDNTMKIKEMAQMVADKIAEGRIRVVYDIPDGNPYGYAAETKLRLSGEKLRSLGWKPEKNIEDMYNDMLHQS